MADFAAPAPIADADVPTWTPELIALDLDGTCVTEDLQLHPRVIAAVAAASLHIPVVIATGRMYRSTLPWAERLGVTTPVICYQGALTREQPQGDTPGRVIATFPLAGEAAQRAIGVAREHGWHRQAYIDDQLLCEEQRHEALTYGAVARVEIVYVDDLCDAVKDGSTKLVCVIEDEPGARACEDALGAALQTSARVVRSRNEFVEVTSTQAGKGLALRSLCADLGVRMERVVAVGDAPNDTDMLAAVGFGVAVKGARQSVLDVARATCDGPGAGGVADVLAAFGYS